MKVTTIALFTACFILAPFQAAQADDTDAMQAAQITQAAEATAAKSPDVKPVDSVKQAVSDTSKAKIRAVFPSRTLRARVSETDEFPQLPEVLEPGNIFDGAKVQALLPSEFHWYEVPKWFAGEFSYGQLQSYYEKDFSTGKESEPHELISAINSGRNRGLLVDKKGNIWQLSRSKQIVDPSHKGEDNYFRYEDEILGFTLSPKEYAESSAGIEFYTDQGKIKDVLRFQRIRNFQLHPDGTVTVDVTEMKFDLDGKPTWLKKVKGPMTRQKPFVAIDPNTQIKGQTYAQIISSLREHMERINKLSDAPVTK